MKYYVDRMCDFPKFQYMPLTLLKDGTVYTKSGDIKTYESGIFSYDSNIPGATFPITSVSDDGTYMDYSLQLFLNFIRDDSSTSYYYTTNYGTASKTFYYKYTGSGSVITPERYYLHITGSVFARCYNDLSITLSGSRSIYYVCVSVVLNQDLTNAKINIGFESIDSNLSINVYGLFMPQTTGMYVRGTVDIPSGVSLLLIDSGDYFLDNSCRGDTRGNYSDTNYYSSLNYGDNFTTSCSTSSVGVTLTNGNLVVATVVVHNHP